MNFLEAILLGLLQGITEFLPVSSSGHLVLASSLMGSDLAPGITFEIVVHFGSFCSIVLYFRESLGELLRGVMQSFTPTAIREKRFMHDKNAKLAFVILASMIPAGLTYVFLEERIEQLFNSPALVSMMLVVTGVLLFLTKFATNTTREVGLFRGFMMGIAQAMALIPGISRSGSTISTGLFLGLKREEVANFSFLMVLPVLGGAMLLDFIDILNDGIEIYAALVLLTGFLTSFLSGYFALKYLIILLRKDKLHYFAFYCWAVGVAGIFYFGAF